MVYKVKANTIDKELLEKIKKSFGDEEIFILNQNELTLLKSITDIENGKNLIEFTEEEFDKLNEKLLAQ